MNNPDDTIWYQPTWWKDKAACRDADPALFFPPIGGGKAAAAAKTFCVSCPVQPECLEFAVSSRMRFGIWGGLTERQRRSVS